MFTRASLITSLWSAEEFDYLVTSFISFTLEKRGISANIKCIGDKTPFNTRYLSSIHRAFPNAKIISIIRDGRDTLVSTYKHAERTLRESRKNVDIHAFALEHTEPLCETLARIHRVCGKLRCQIPPILSTPYVTKTLNQILMIPIVSC